jgi:quercetin dioxygenase-like cupin family protein
VTTIAEPEGGEPACLAHLFADLQEQGDELTVSAAEPGSRGNEPAIVELAAIARAGTAAGAAWTHQSDDLDTNLLVFATGQGVDEHVNDEVDVLLVGIAGEGVVTVDGARRILRPGRALVIAKGTRRGTLALRDPFAYLTCHRRRSGLWPSVSS